MLLVLRNLNSLTGFCVLYFIKIHMYLQKALLSHRRNVLTFILYFTLTVSLCVQHKHNQSYNID